MLNVKLGGGVNQGFAMLNWGCLLRGGLGVVSLRQFCGGPSLDGH